MVIQLPDRLNAIENAFLMEEKLTNDVMLILEHVCVCHAHFD